MTLQRRSYTGWMLSICGILLMSRSGVTQTEFKLNAADGDKDSMFGTAVAISADRTIVGSGRDTGLSDKSGSAYIFTGKGKDRFQIAKLVAADGEKEDRFGFSVAISDNYAIVGADGDDDLGKDSGAAYIFEWNGSSWIQTKKLIADDGNAGDLFGSSVAISGEYAIIGAPGGSGIDEQTGSAYVFRRNGATWIQAAKLSSGDGARDDLFGISVAISENYAIVGASGDDDAIVGIIPVRDVGSAYLFRRNGVNWLQSKKLTSNDQGGNNKFGAAVAMNDNCAVIGAVGDDNNTGSAYVFTNDGTDWTQTGELTANDRSQQDGFGNSVSVSGDFIIVGASGDDDLGDQSGSAYIFKRDPSWMQVRKLTSADGSKEDLFGFAVAVGENYAIVGAPNDDDRGNQSGSAYAYDFAELSVTPLSLDFADSLNSQILTLTNDGLNPVTWSASGDQDWIVLEPATGLLPLGSDSISVIVDRTLLPAGDYPGTVTVNSNVGSTIVAINMSVLLPPAVNIAPPTRINATTATVNGSVNANNQATDVTFEYGLTTDYGNTLTATPKLVTGNSPVAVSAEVEGLSPGTLYHYRIVATNGADTTRSIDKSFTTYAATFDLSTTIDFRIRQNAYDYDATEYRIVGLPGAGNQLVSSLLSGMQDEDWQVYWDNGDPDNFFLPYDGSDVFRLAAGRAFWVINKNSWPISITVPSAPLNAESVVEIPLRQGFNLITNPFPTPINWRDVQDFNGIADPVFDYNGSFVTSPDFDPFVGYYFFNDSLDVLRVPYALTFSSAPQTSLASHFFWKINISVSSGSSRDELLTLGTAGDASPEIDRFDFRKPRALGKGPAIYFNRADWDRNFNVFASDIRPAIEEQEIWHFEVSAAPQTPLELTFADVESVPAQYDVYLVNDANGDYVDLRSESNYRFSNSATLSRFHVMVGDLGEIGEALNSALPDEFVLGDNYPNPFNPSTSFYVSLPLASTIKVRVYNILGVEIRTIYEGPVEAGRRLFNWNGVDATGKEVASGVYLYTLTVDGKKSLTRKMILMR